MADHPLMKPSSWALWSGPGGAAGISRAAAAFWVSGGLMTLAWTVGLLHEAFVWGLSPLLCVAGLSVALGWCWLAWSTWTAWRASRPPLTLLWTGPVRDLPVSDADQPVQTGGFRVLQWDAPVQVEVLMDLQRWMLLRLRTLGAGAPRREAWLWLHAQPPGATRVERDALHQLRTLLYLPSSMTMSAVLSPRRGVSLSGLMQAMASWAQPFKTGSKLRSTAHPGARAPVSLTPSSRVRVGRESAFPSTLILREDDAPDSLAGAGWRDSR